MTQKQWPRALGANNPEDEWNDQEQALFNERYAEIVALGLSRAPKTIEQLLNNRRIIVDNVPEEHRGYFTNVLLTHELMVDIASRIVALEDNR